MGRALASLTIVAGLVATLWVGTGCDEGDGLDGLTVTPNAVTLSNVYTVVFTASVKGALALPLEWRVSNPDIGAIQASSGSNAVYEAFRQSASSDALLPGANVITARDQYGNEGSAGVTQR